LRQLALDLQIDQAVLSKMERGERSFRRIDLEILSKRFKELQKKLLTLWLADKLLKTTKNEKLAKDALQLAIENI
jgi:hypothetical protein